MGQSDLIFTFVGLDSPTVEFRCSAKPFLASPWPLDLRDVGNPKRKQPQTLIRAWEKPSGRINQNHKDYSYILGMVSSLVFRLYAALLTQSLSPLKNFFWTAFVRLNAESCDMSNHYSESSRREPFIQLGAQRVLGRLDNGKEFVLDGDVFEINKDGLPGVHQVRDRNRPGFAMKP